VGQQQWVAIDSSTDRRRWARTLARAHERALTGDGAQPEVREVISPSWRRVSGSGIDPVHGLAPLEIPSEEAEARWRESQLNVAEPLLQELLADVGDAGQQVVLVCDRAGMMLWIDGDEAVVDAGTSIHLQRGSRWSEESAGTNAMGTALAAGHPLQVFSAEHFSVPVHSWTCSAALVRDPETGETVGVLDLSGELSTAHPHSLALVEAAARMVEASLAQRAAARAAALREKLAARVGTTPGNPVALSSAAGTIIETKLEPLHGRRLLIPSGGGEVGRELGLSLVAEPVDGPGFLIWRSGNGLHGENGEAISASLLGRDRALVVVAGRSAELSRRHSELLFLLSLRPEGMTAEQLALALYGDFGKPVTARAEMSRLRQLVGSAIAAHPYRLTSPLIGNFIEVEELVARGRLREALERYSGPLLPSSEVPLVVEARQSLDDLVRDAILESGSPSLLDAWLQNPSGRDDLEACRRLVRSLAPGEPRRPAALSRLRRLCGTAAPVS